MSYAADRDLARRALLRQADAVREFAERVACVVPFLRSLAHRYGPGITEAAIDDMVQETYLALWRKLGAYRGESKLETWACGFASIELRRWRERTARIGERRIEVAEESYFDADPTEDRVELIDRELDEIGGPTASVIRLKHVEDLTFEQIGGRLDMSPNTAKSLYYRGLARLRERLKGLEEELAE